METAGYRSTGPEEKRPGALGALRQRWLDCDITASAVLKTWGGFAAIAPKPLPYWQFPDVRKEGGGQAAACFGRS